MNPAAAGGRSCCFTGHRIIARDVREPLRNSLREVIGVLYEEGFRRFYAGGALGFDTLAALKVLDKKKKYPHIRLELILPCRDQARTWQERNVQVYRYILERADRVSYVTDTYTPTCMHERNRRLVDGSAVCVAYCTNAEGGTAYTRRYAEKNGVEVVEIL